MTSPLLLPSVRSSRMQLAHLVDGTLQQNASASVGVDIPGCQYTDQFDGNPIEVKWGGFLRHTLTGGLAELAIIVDGAAVPGEALAITSRLGNDGYAVSRVTPLTLSPGQHTIKLQLFSIQGNANAQAKGDAGLTTYMIIDQL